ncbi:MAG: hypothetical protein HQL90_13765 [Magnetococcales bacterium]|nr:hypothetical protein [Magnetococcales bacterium]
MDSACASIIHGDDGRNDALFKAGASMAELVAGGVLEEGETTQSLWDAARTAGLQDDEIRATLKSAFARGSQNPRTTPDRPGGHQQARRQTPPPGRQASPDQDEKAKRAALVAQQVCRMAGPSPGTDQYSIKKHLPPGTLLEIPMTLLTAIIGYHPKDPSQNKLNIS